MALETSDIEKRISSMSQAGIFDPGDIELPEARSETRDIGGEQVTGSPVGLDVMEQQYQGQGGSKYAFQGDNLMRAVQGQEGTFQTGRQIPAAYKSAAKDVWSSQTVTPGGDNWNQMDSLSQMAQEHGVPGAEDLFKKIGKTMLQDPDKGAEALAKAETAIKGYISQKGQLTTQQANADAAMEERALSSEQYIAGLQGIDSTINTALGDASAGWAKAAEQADEYAQGYALKTQESLDTLKGIYKDVQSDLNFAKAHDMNAAVDAALGSMASGGREIAQRYGKDSAEYAQHQQNRTKTLGAMQSSIQGTYGKLRFTLGQNYLSATNETLWKMNMYQSFQEQQHVDVLKASASFGPTYELQAMGLKTSLAQLANTEHMDFANYVASQPIFALDQGSLVDYLANLVSSEALGGGSFGGRTSRSNTPAPTGDAAPSMNMSQGNTGGGVAPSSSHRLTPESRAASDASHQRAVAARGSSGPENEFPSEANYAGY